MLQGLAWDRAPTKGPCPPGSKEKGEGGLESSVCAAGCEPALPCTSPEVRTSCDQDPGLQEKLGDRGGPKPEVAEGGCPGLVLQCGL